MLSRASAILVWQENLSEDEMPPRWMWALDDELNKHFKRVRQERKRKYGDDSPDDDDDDTSEDWGGVVPPGGLMQNEYARNRGRNAR